MSIEFYTNFSKNALKKLYCAESILNTFKLVNICLMSYPDTMTAKDTKTNSFISSEEYTIYR